MAEYEYEREREREKGLDDSVRSRSDKKRAITQRGNGLFQRFVVFANGKLQFEKGYSWIKKPPLSSISMRKYIRNRDLKERRMIW